MILVTGAAGFIGSNLCEQLLTKGYKVLGVDSFYDNYPRWIKKHHIRYCLGHPNFIFLESNILDPSIKKLIEGLKIDCIVHLADIPGVTSCSEVNFDDYIRYNITATQRLLEAIKNKGVKKIIYASSSTVYGDIDGMAMSEVSNPKPISLYGVTKLAGEALCYHYSNIYEIELTMLRFFTTYGPMQRPDMAFHRFIKSMLMGEKINVYGDGTQSRDFIYVKDVCDVIINTIEAEMRGDIINVGGGESLSVNDAIKILEEIIGVKAKINFTPPLIQEQLITHAAVNKLHGVINLNNKTRIADGLQEEVKYIRKLYGLPR